MVETFQLSSHKRLQKAELENHHAMNMVKTHELSDGIAGQLCKLENYPNIQKAENSPSSWVDHVSMPFSLAVSLPEDTRGYRWWYMVPS